MATYLRRRRRRHAATSATGNSGGASPRPSKAGGSTKPSSPGSRYRARPGHRPDKRKGAAKKPPKRPPKPPKRRRPPKGKQKGKGKGTNPLAGGPNLDDVKQHPSATQHGSQYTGGGVAAGGGQTVQQGGSAAAGAGDNSTPPQQVSAPGPSGQATFIAHSGGQHLSSAQAAASSPSEAAAIGQAQADRAAYEKAQRKYKREQRAIQKVRDYAADVSDKHERQRAYHEATQRENRNRKPEKPLNLIAHDAGKKIKSVVPKLIHEAKNGLTDEQTKRLIKAHEKDRLDQKFERRYKTKVPQGVSTERAAKQIELAYTKAIARYRVQKRAHGVRQVRGHLLDPATGVLRQGPGTDIEPVKPKRSDVADRVVQRIVEKHGAKEREEAYVKAKEKGQETAKFVLPPYEKSIKKQAARNWTNQLAKNLNVSPSKLSKAQKDQILKKAKRYAAGAVERSERLGHRYGATPEMGQAFWHQVSQARYAAPTAKGRERARRLYANREHVKAQPWGVLKMVQPKKKHGKGRKQPELKVKTPVGKQQDVAQHKREKDVRQYQAYMDNHVHDIGSFFSVTWDNVKDAVHALPDTAIQFVNAGFDLLKGDPTGVEDLIVQFDQTDPTWNFYKTFFETGSFTEAADQNRELYAANPLGVLTDLASAITVSSGIGAAAKAGSWPAKMARATARPSKQLENAARRESFKGLSPKERRAQYKQQTKAAREGAANLRREDRVRARMGDGPAPRPRYSESTIPQRYSRSRVIRTVQKGRERYAVRRGRDPFELSGKAYERSLTGGRFGMGSAGRMVRRSQAASTMSGAVQVKIGSRIAGLVGRKPDKIGLFVLDFDKSIRVGSELEDIADLRKQAAKLDDATLRGVQERILDLAESNFNQFGSIHGKRGAKVSEAIEIAHEQGNSIEDMGEREHHLDREQRYHRRGVAGPLKRGEVVFVGKKEPLPGQEEKIAATEEAKAAAKREQEAGVRDKEAREQAKAKKKKQTKYKAKAEEEAPPAPGKQGKTKPLTAADRKAAKKGAPMPDPESPAFREWVKANHEAVAAWLAKNKATKSGRTQAKLGDTKPTAAQRRALTEQDKWFEEGPPVEGSGAEGFRRPEPGTERDRVQAAENVAESQSRKAPPTEKGADKRARRKLSPAKARKRLEKRKEAVEK